MKKILMISYHFPPEEGSCSNKNIKILATLTDAGYDVDVLTVGNDCEGETFNDSNIYRVHGGRFHKGKNEIGCRDVVTKQSHGIKNRLKNFVKRVIIPDPVIDWKSNVLKWSKEHSSLMKDYGMILSISSPYSAHLISRSISKCFNIPYICSYGDPWIYEPSRKRGKIRQYIEYNLEKHVVVNAKKVLVITAYNKQKYKKLYGLPEEKVDTYNIGFSDSNKTTRRTNIADKVRLIYGGSLNPIHRNVKPFLQAARKVSDICVDIYNEDYSEILSMIEEYELQEKVNVEKLIPSSKFNDELYLSDVLLLFGNKTVFQVPGKLFEFISTGTHILYIKNSNEKGDASEKILKKYGNVTIIDNTEKEIIRGLTEIVKKHHAGELNQVCNKEEFEYHKTMKPIADAVGESMKAEV